MNHILDNPAWNALISANSDLALGDDEVRYFPPEVSPFAGFKKVSAESLQQLYEMLDADRVAAIITSEDLSVPGSWKILFQASLFQMTCQNYRQGSSMLPEFVPLGKEHVMQMIELTKLTNPGPFAERTIEFGHYSGIFQDDKLVAMAGQRLHAFNYSEISAVCTHPEHLGKGYGTALVRQQAERILQSGNIPFLHVRKDNQNAIKIYEKMGFSIRKEMNFCVIRRLEGGTVEGGKTGS